MRYSVWCVDGLPFADPGVVSQQTNDEFPLFGGLESAAFDPAICKIWNVQAASLAEHRAVTSAIPTIVVAGSYDPNTPPRWGRRQLRTLTNAFFFEYPGFSHTPTSSVCAREMSIAFLDAPSRAPDATCIARMAGMAFE